MKNGKQGGPGVEEPAFEHGSIGPCNELGIELAPVDAFFYPGPEHGRRIIGQGRCHIDRTRNSLTSGVGALRDQEPVAAPFLRQGRKGDAEQHSGNKKRFYFQERGGHKISFNEKTEEPKKIIWT